MRSTGGQRAGGERLGRSPAPPRRSAPARGSWRRRRAPRAAPAPGCAPPPRYVAILAYLRPSEEFDAAVDALRAALRDATTATTTFGYGPRFQHSTGQYHKGGPPNGLFLQLIHDGDVHQPIPGASYSFDQLKNAQATGDFLTLRDHDLPVERVRLQGDPVDALRDLTAKIKEML